MYDSFFGISNKKMLLKEKGLQHSNTSKRVEQGIERKTALQSNKERNKKDFWRIDHSHPSKLLAFRSLQRHHMMLAEQPSKSYVTMSAEGILPCNKHIGDPQWHKLLESKQATPIVHSTGYWAMEKKMIF